MRQGAESVASRGEEQDNPLLAAVTFWQQIKPVKPYCLTTPYTRTCPEFTEEDDFNIVFCHLASEAVMSSDRMITKNNC